jgi:hypothetical protein
MAGIGKYKKGAKFTLKSGNAPSFEMMGSTSPFDMVGDEMVDRARKSKARTDLLKQLTPEEKAKYDALSGKEKFHVSQNTDLSQMRQALAGDDMDDMEGGVAAAGAMAGAGTRGAMKYTGATDEMDQNFQGWGKSKKKKSEGKIPWSKAPKSGTQERIDFYKKHNLAMDDTTKLKETKKA